VAIIHVSFSLIGSVPDMVELVEKQLSNYYYTFPTALNVSFAFFCMFLLKISLA
jgi:hypothetical protein